MTVSDRSRAFYERFRSFNDVLLCLWTFLPLIFIITAIKKTQKTAMKKKKLKLAKKTIVTVTVIKISVPQNNCLKLLCSVKIYLNIFFTLDYIRV